MTLITPYFPFRCGHHTLPKKFEMSRFSAICIRRGILTFKKIPYWQKMVTIGLWKIRVVPLFFHCCGQNHSARFMHYIILLLLLIQLWRHSILNAHQSCFKHRLALSTEPIENVEFLFYSVKSLIILLK